MDAPSNEDPVSPQLDFYYFLRPLIIPLRRCSEILLAPKPELVPQDGILVSELAHFHEGIVSRLFLVVHSFFLQTKKKLPR